LVDSGKIETIFSDAVSKLITTTEENKKIKKIRVINVDIRNDKILSQKVLILKDFVRRIPEFEKSDLVSVIMSQIKSDRRIKKIKSKGENFFFYVKSSSKLHKILFSLWIELLTGFDMKKEFGVERDILFEAGTNYRFPISSLELISTRNMLKALSKSAMLIAQGNFLITENLESKAIALILSATVPKSKKFIVLKGSEKFLERIHSDRENP